VENKNVVIASSNHSFFIFHSGNNHGKLKSPQRSPKDFLKKIILKFCLSSLKPNCYSTRSVYTDLLEQIIFKSAFRFAFAFLP